MNSLPRPISMLQRGPCRVIATSMRRMSTVPVTSIMVKELREKSGAPMMDCKKALSDASVTGDIEKAMNWLRMKGIARASAGERVSQEGLIAFLYTDKVCTLIEVNSETDFVGKNEKFHSFVAMLANVCSKNMPAEGAIDIPALLKMSPGEGSSSGETIADSLGDIVSQIRENIVIRRAINLETSSASSVLAGYVHGRVGVDHLPAHIMMGKTAALIRLEIGEGASAGAGEAVMEMGKKLAMHVVAASPAYLKPDEVPAATIETETAIFRQQSEEAIALKASTGKGKEPTPEMMDKIIQGKVAKRMADICLLNQAHVAEEGSPVVSKFLETFGKNLGSKVHVPLFHRWTLGQTN